MLDALLNKYSISPFFQAVVLMNTFASLELVGVRIHVHPVHGHSNVQQSIQCHLLTLFNRSFGFITLVPWELFPTLI